MWNVVITGIVNTEDQDEVIRRASIRLKLSPRKIQKILNSTPKIVKSGLDQSLADKYVYSLKKIGLLAEANQQSKLDRIDAQQGYRQTRGRQQIYFALILGVLLSGVIGIWIFDRLVALETSLQPAHIFESEFEALSSDSITTCSYQVKSEFEWDITDYSYNVIEDPKDKIFRYEEKTAK